MTMRERLTQPGNAFLAVSIVMQIVNLALIDAKTHVEASARIALSGVSLVFLLVGVFIRWNRVITPGR